MSIRECSTLLILSQYIFLFTWNCFKKYLIVVSFKGWRDNSAGWVFALHGADPYSILDISYDCLRLPKVIPERRPWSNPRTLLVVAPKQNTTKCMRLTYNTYNSRKENSQRQPRSCLLQLRHPKESL